MGARRRAGAGGASAGRGATGRVRVAALGALTLLTSACASVPQAAGPPPSSAPARQHSHAHASPAPDAPGRRLRSPFTSLRRYLAGRLGVVTAAVYDRRTRQLWVYHPRVEYTASIVKVQIMGAALWEAQQAGHGLPGSEAQLIPPMIEASDNSAATAVLADVGGPVRVGEFDRAAGLLDTQPHAASPPIPGTPWPAWGLTTTTARDQVVLMMRFAYPNAVLSGRSRRYGLSLMRQVEAGQNWGVSYGLPAGTVVALKDGWIPFPRPLPHAGPGWQVDSIGWIHGHGRDYVLAVLTSGSPSEQYGIDTVQVISQQVFTQLGPASG